jgi:hypothetical protein
MDCDDGPYGTCYIFCQVCRRKRSGEARIRAGEISACLYLFLVSENPHEHKMLWSYKICAVFFGKNLIGNPLSLEENCDIISANEEIRCML